MKVWLKENKGFSLVELIVVILIMAIIAIALAPQILKWVNNSRISTDMQTKDTLVGAGRVWLTASRTCIPSESPKSSSASASSSSAF